MKNILIAEDDKKIGAALEIRLKAAGYAVHLVTDGAEGLKCAIQDRPDLILMDIWLPKEMGFSVAEHLKSAGLSDIPIIFITASRKKDLWKTAQDVGAVDFFEKPFEIEKLVASISRNLQSTPLTKEEITK